jgi:uncharacterized damage-inducible protein DinB
MAPEQKTEIVQHLERGHRDFLAAVSGLSEAQAAHRPDPTRWSVLDCVEHVTTVEQRFLGWLEADKRAGVPPIDKEKEASLLARVSDRSNRAQAPEAVVPTGRFGTLAEALEQFSQRRSRSIQFAVERCNDLYSLAAEHARFGPLNGAEVMMLIVGHADRHKAQIQEVRASLNQTEGN